MINKSYILKHWITTLFLAPVISQIIEFIFGKSHHQVVGLFEVFPVTLIFSIVFSLPALVIYIFTFYFLYRNKVTFLVSKLTLIIVSVVTISITLILIGGTMFNEMIVAYSLSALVTGLFFSIRIKQNKKYAVKTS